MSNDIGKDLYDTVVEYSSLGEHRSGTPVDHATVDWFAQKCKSLGGSVEKQPYEFDRYDVEWEVKIDGEEVVSIPLFYEGVGDVRTDRPAVGVMKVSWGTYLHEFEAFAQQALADGCKAAVIATDTRTGLLMAPNRQVKIGSGLPTICVSGDLKERLSTSRLEVMINARIIKGDSANVLATFGQGRWEDRVLLSTPLSGWFRCAAERGAGIAVCLEVARVLSDIGPVAVLGTNGHELMGYGVRHYLANQPLQPAGIFHFGANFAGGVPDDQGNLQIPDRIGIFGWVREDRRDLFIEAFKHLKTPVRCFNDEQAAQRESWIGEAAGWYELKVPLISMAGGKGSRLHHAPEDIPELATTPDILAALFQGALSAAKLLIS
jgi:hypothetical protein